MNYPDCDITMDTPTRPEVKLITQHELVTKLVQQDDFVFVMAMDQGRFEQAHIEGSISFDRLLDDLPTLPSDRDIVVYCTDAACAASKLRASMLVNEGFANVARYAGGLAEWTASGLPIVEGQLV